jgi:hypothetical protein
MSAVPAENNEPAVSPRVSGFNWGALAATPAWLFRNGFWGSCLLYCFFWFYCWPLIVPMRFLFFVRGTQWSWGNGRRWHSFEQFADSQYAWGFAGRVLLTFEALSIVTSVHSWLTNDH